MYQFCRFIGQGQDEVILYRSHRHWIHFVYILLRNMLTVAIGMLTLSAITYLVLVAILGYPGGSELVSLLISVSVLALIATVILTWTIYYLTLSILTDRRLIKIVQKSIFYHYSREVKLTGLQDTSFTYANWIQSMFNYGSLVSHAASGEEGKFELNFIPNPRDLHHYINKIYNAVEKAQHENVKPDLPPYRSKGWGKKHMKKQSGVGSQESGVQNSASMTASNTTSESIESKDENNTSGAPPSSP